MNRSTCQPCQSDVVLALSVVLEHLLIAVERPAVGLDGDLQLGEGDVGLVWADPVVGLPSCNAGLSKQFDEQSLGLGTGSVGGGYQEPTCLGRAVAALVPKVCPP